MSNVTYIQPDGDSQSVNVPVGLSVMMGGVNAGIHGIVAECGGSLSCATCHVYVESSSRPLPALSDDEEDMLEWTASPREESSRLSCQLVIQVEDETMVVRVPDKQL